MSEDDAFAERIRVAKESGAFAAFFDELPYSKFLGVRLAIDGDGLRARMPFAQHLVGNPMLPALHGGTIGALLEHVALCTVLHELELTALPKTINLTIDYLRSGKAEDTLASASIVRAGRRVQTVQSIAWQGDRDKPIAIATVHILARRKD